MNFSRFEFWAEGAHHALMHLNTRHSLEFVRFDNHFPMVLSACEVNHIHGCVRKVGQQSLFHVFSCHRGQKLTPNRGTVKGLNTWNLADLDYALAQRVLSSSVDEKMERFLPYFTRIFSPFGNGPEFG